ncbi:GPI-anchored protein LLG1-like [Curcuma longa]|uniref:GPI-anchored protein LLG1-like n=1 Tax=Curcuma longa TaxID=136217 RepID=UPI003D9E53C8
MDSNPMLSLMVAVLSAVAGLAAASSFISDDALVSHGARGRSLLQATTSCPVSFEFMNYTIITSRCKGPLYPADQCCGALADFACPYSVEINDLTNNCAQIMFSYIHNYGNYPPGLFANECHGGKLGISCTASAPQSQISSSTDHKNQQSLISLALLLCGSLLGFLLC